MKIFKRKTTALCFSLLLLCLGTFFACKSPAPVSSESSSKQSSHISLSSAIESDSSIIEPEESISSFSSIEIIESSSHNSSNKSSDLGIESESSETLSSQSADESSFEASYSSGAEDSSIEESVFDSSDFESVASSSSSESWHEHEFDESVLYEPTCLKKGLLVKTCKDCHYEIGEDIAPLGHEETIDYGYAPTCQITGKTDGSHCSRCKLILRAQDDIPTVDHVYEKHVCKWCPSTNLLFELHSSGQYYICAGSIEETLRYLYIPAYYKGKEVREIKERAFECRLHLIYVELPETLTKIRDLAFADCFNLTEICNLSKTLKPDEDDITAHGYVFLDRKHIFTNPTESRISTDEEGFITYKDGNQVALIGYCGTSVDLVIPEEITEINARMFETINGLKSVVVSKNITKLKSLTFENCYSLEKVVIGAGVTEMQVYLFGYDLPPAKLKEVIFEETETWYVVNKIATRIDAGAFSNHMRLFHYLFVEYYDFTWVRE